MKNKTKFNMESLRKMNTQHTLWSTKKQLVSKTTATHILNPPEMYFLYPNPFPIHKSSTSGHWLTSYLSKWQFIYEWCSILGNIFHLFEYSSSILSKFHKSTNIIFWGEQLNLHGEESQADDQLVRIDTAYERQIWK